MRLAIIADVHGNADALVAVLDDIAEQKVDRIINLGDHLSGPLEARRTADLLSQVGMVAIRGNHDRYLLEQAPDAMGPSDRSAFLQLRAAHLDWLRRLPSTLWLEDIYCCHGSPVSDEAYWLEKIAAGRLQLRDHDEIAQGNELWSGEKTASLALCGHSHVPRTIRLASGTLIVNPGSVGCPGYTDDRPAHIMQVGSADARYAIVEQFRATWRVNHIAVPYDSRRMAEMAADTGRSEWSRALSGGWIT